MARPRQSESVRVALLDKGVSSFLRTGYHGTGIKEVLDAVKVPKGSFYNYFESKEAFAVAVVEHYAACFAKKMKDSMDGASCPVDGLRHLFRRLAKDFEDNGFVGGCLIANLGGELEGSEICRNALSEAWTGWSNAVAEALQEGQKEGLIRDDVEATTLAGLLTESWEGAVIRMKIERSTQPLERVIERLLDDYFKP